MTLAYKFSLPKPIEKSLLINKGDSIICRAGYSWVPRYYDLSSDDIRKNKNVFLGGCGYTFKQHFFIRATAFWFPDSSQQQPERRLQLQLWLCRLYAGFVLRPVRELLGDTLPPQ